MRVWRLGHNTSAFDHDYLWNDVAPGCSIAARGLLLEEGASALEADHFCLEQRLR